MDQSQPGQSKVLVPYAKESSFMAVAEKAEVPAMAQPDLPAAEAGKAAAEKSSKPAKEKKPRSAKAPKEKKPRAPKAAAPSHPTYFQMIKEAILALKEKSGSSPYAVAKHMEEKYKAVLPANFRKMLTLQLRNCVAKGKLVKVRGSFKLSEAAKKAPAVKKAVPVKHPAAATAKPKPKPDSEKKKRKAPEARKKPARAVAAAKPKAGAKRVKKKKATPAKPKQPKSIRSPAAKKARKVAAA